MLISDVDQEIRWPDDLPAARGQGLRCSLSLPLTVGGSTVGAMDLYAFEESGMFTNPVRHRCGVFAAQASGALHLILGRTAPTKLLDQLDQALATRSTIDRAIGVLMGQQRCTVDEAFALLRMRFQRSNVKLRDIGADLIPRVTGQPPQPGKPFDRNQNRSRARTDRSPPGPIRVWAVDFRFDSTTDGRPIKIVAIVHEDTRACLGGLVELIP